MEYKEGYIPFHGFKTYYRIFGKCEPGKYPLLTLHGGPGALHNYLLSIKDVAKSGRAVIFYDQIGCGKSPADLDDSQWTEDLFCGELDAVREALGLEKVHLLGQSAGGMLAQHYMLYHGEPEGVLSVTLSSSLPSMRLWGEEGERLRSYLPKEMQEAINKAFETKDFSSPDYKAAEAEYYRRHVCSLDPYPQDVLDSFENESHVYNVMQGRCEFDISGNLKDWSSIPDLHRINVPVLAIHGNDDESTPLLNKVFFDNIPDCRWEIIQHGTHLCHYEYPLIYNLILEDFLDGVEEKLRRIN